MDSLVSILIPAYNAAQWIDETLRSAIDQKWNKKEIIVIDDGSRDATTDIVRARESSILKLVRQENQGAATARNHALSLAQGDYIQWLDADDLLAPDKITRQMQAAAGNSPGTLFSSAFGQFHYRVSRARFAPGPLWKDLSPADWLKVKFSNGTWMNPAVWLVSRQIAERAGPWNQSLTLDDDGEYFARIVASSDYVRFIPEARSYYRQWNPHSLSRAVGEKANRSLLKSLKLSVGYLLALDDSAAARTAAVAYLQSWMWHFCSERVEILDELKAFARELGGELGPPNVSFKYDLIHRWFGWAAAYKAAGIVASIKLSAHMKWDRLHPSNS